MSIPPIRSDLSALVGYHSAQVDAKVRLNTNESPFAPPQEFVDDFVAGLKDEHLNRYPDRRASALRAAIAHADEVHPDRVFCANGSNEVLQSLLLAYGGAGRQALVFEPTYALHSHIARVTGTSVVAVNRLPDFTLSPDYVRGAIEKEDPSLVFLCSPNNPTGLSESLDVMKAALNTTSGLVIVDEAYGQFALDSATQLFKGVGGERLVVVRTFSKTWGLAGVRLGYCLADPAIVEACFSVCLPYHLSSLTQSAGMRVLKYGSLMDDHVEAIVAERTRVLNELNKLDVEVWPSESNFILFRPLSQGAEMVWQGLVDRSVLIRDCSSWKSLEGCLRVTIGTREENTAFLNALKETL